MPVILFLAVQRYLCLQSIEALTCAATVAMSASRTKKSMKLRKALELATMMSVRLVFASLCVWHHRSSMAARQPDQPSAIEWARLALPPLHALFDGFAREAQDPLQASDTGRAEEVDRRGDARWEALSVLRS